MRKILSLLIVIALAGVGLAVSTLALAPQAHDLITATRVEDPEVNLRPLHQRSVIYAQDGTVLASLHTEENRANVPLREIPDQVVQTILAVEDEHFYDHGPVDLRSTVRALFENVQAGDVEQGGSTITQQLVKNSLLTPEQDLDRKLQEAVLAVQLERELSKDQILQRYLNEVYFGGGAYGVQAAAELYFDTDVGNLDWGQSALLASLIQNPVRYDPVRAPERAQRRRHVALQRLVDTGHLTQRQADFYNAAPLPTVRNTPLPAPNDYFVEEVKRQLLNDERLGATEAERYNRVFRGGLRIYTTFRPAAQYYALIARQTEIPENGGVFTAALASLDVQTGAVRALVGGPGFDHYKYDLATQGLRQPGSSFKMIVLMAALENGVVPNDTLSGSSPCSFPNPGGAPDPYVAENFGGESGGTGTITQLTTQSSNCGYLRLGQVVGLDKVKATARKLGITTPLDPRALSMPIGAFEVHPIEMAGMAATIANHGVYNEPYYIDRVENRHGDVLWTHHPTNERVVSEQSACLETNILEANVQGGTGTAAQLPNGRPAAGKTGTAQSFGDAWFVGYTPQLATAVWMGNPEARVPMTNVGGRSVTGGTYPAMVWHDFMAAAHTLAPIEAFPSCFPTRPGKALGQIPNFGVPPGGGGGGQETPQTQTQTFDQCPGVGIPADLNGDGQIESCVDPTPAAHGPTGDASADPTADGPVAMSALEDLLGVQEHDTTLDQLRHRLGALPEQAALDAKLVDVANLEQDTAAVQTERDTIGHELKRLEDERASLEARGVEVNQALYGGTVTAPRELKALQDEMQSLKRRQRALEDDELELMEQAEPLDAKLAELAAAHEAADTEATSLTAALAEAQVEIAAEIESVQGLRDVAVAQVGDELLTEYDRLRGQLGGIAIARLMGASCGGCHLHLSSVEIDRIKHAPAEVTVHCEECGRILVH